MPNKPNTRILDATLDALRDKPSARRARRTVDVTITVTMLASTTYLITSNGRTLEQGEGDLEYATARANKRTATIRAMGKTVRVEVV